MVTGNQPERFKTYCTVFLVLFFSIVLRFYQLGHGGYGCPSSSGNARSMLHSWWHFFFVAWDPAGTYMQDKPPVADWLQSISVLHFGYSGFSLILPQALAGAINLLLLYRLIVQLDERRPLALWAVAAMAVAPVSVLVSRSNKVDEFVVLFILVTANLLVEYSRTRKFRALLLASVAGGLAFNVKGLAMAVAAPSLLLLLMEAKPWRDLPSGRSRIITAGLLFVICSLGWMIIVDLTPVHLRPRVMNSENNRMLELLLIHNGISRVSESSGFNPADHMKEEGPETIPMGVFYGGPHGFSRIMNEFPGKMLSGFLPLVLSGMIAGLADWKNRSRRINAIFWNVWLLVGYLTYSMSRMGSAHYIELFFPPLAVMVGTTLHYAATDFSWRGRVACFGLAGGLFSALHAYRFFPAVGTLVIYLSLIGLVLLAVHFLRIIFRRSHIQYGLINASSILFLLIPFSLSTICVIAKPVEGVLPGVVFLELLRKGEGKFTGEIHDGHYITGKIGESEPALDYVYSVEPNIKYLIAGPTFSFCSSVITKYDRSALPIQNEFLLNFETGPAELARLITRGDLRFILLPRLRVKNYPQDLRTLLQLGKDVSGRVGWELDSPWILLDFAEFNPVPRS